MPSIRVASPFATFQQNPNALLAAQMRMEELKQNEQKIAIARMLALDKIEQAKAASRLSEARTAQAGSVTDLNKARLDALKGQTTDADNASGAFLRALNAGNPLVQSQEPTLEGERVFSQNQALGAIMRVVLSNPQAARAMMQGVVTGPNQTRTDLFGNVVMQGVQPQQRMVPFGPSGSSLFNPNTGQVVARTPFMGQPSSTMMVPGDNGSYTPGAQMPARPGAAVKSLDQNATVFTKTIDNLLNYGTQKDIDTALSLLRDTAGKYQQGGNSAPPPMPAMPSSTANSNPQGQRFQNKKDGKFYRFQNGQYVLDSNQDQ